MGEGLKGKSYPAGGGETVPAPGGGGIGLRPITDDDREFLFRLYASTRAEEQALVGWPDEEWEAFLRMQFDLQHRQYMRNYANPTFAIIVADGRAAGRMYVDHRVDETRLIDIAILPEYRSRGIAGKLLRGLLREADGRGVPVSLHVERHNPILDYYRRLGFRIEEDKGVYCFMVRPVPVGRHAATEERRKGDDLQEE